MERKAGFCTLCRSRCGAWYLVEGERLVGVEPRPDHPTGLALCPKGRAAPELVYHPQRLRQPLKRTRPKTDPDPGWVAVGWDEAMADIAARLLAIRSESGAEAVAFSSASPGATPISDSLEWIERLIFAFGSPNFVTGVEICNWYRDVSHAHTTGSALGMPDYANAELVVLWGFNPGNAWLAQANALSAARERGARLLVIDPARNRHARDADLWLRVRPGTDAALALGLARCLLESGRLAEEFVRCWSNAPLLVREDTGELLRDAQGSYLAWDLASGAPVAIDTTRELSPSQAASLALRGSFAAGEGTLRCRPAFDHFVAACADYTPQRVEELTGVPAVQVQAAADAIAQAGDRVAYFCWTGIAQHVNATQADRAIASLFALTGSIDATGGNLELVRQPAHKVNDRSLMAPAQWERALGLQERPLGPAAHGWALGRDVYRAVLDGEPYRVRALVGFGANLLLSQADTPRAMQALQALEFQVHCDLFETPTGRYADYLLPVNTPWEREGLRIGFEFSGEAEDRVQLRQRIVPQAADDASRSDLEIVFDLAVRLGLGARFFDGEIEAGWNHQLAPLGLTVDMLRRQPDGIVHALRQRPRKYREPSADGGVRGFATPTRRIEFYSERLLRHGYPAVPRSGAPLADVALDAQERARFPLTLACAKSGYFCHSQHHGLASLRRRVPEPVAHLHPALAAARGIAPGDWFRISTRNGGARFRAALDANLDPSVVMASYGWWQACEDLGLPAVDIAGPDSSHYNGLVSTERIDAVAGSIALRAFPCEVSRGEARAPGWDGFKAFHLRLVPDAEGDRPQDVMELALAPVDGQPLPDFHPGQYVPFAIELAGLGRVERSYSLIGPAVLEGRHEYRVAIKHVPGTQGVAGALRSLLEAGGPPPVAQLQTPRGVFLLPVEGAAPVVLVAAGIGITPFLGLLETLAARAEAGLATPQVTLLHGNRGPASRAFGRRIAALGTRIPGLRVIEAFSRTAAEGAIKGHITAEAVPQALIAQGARFYLCGPSAMLGELGAALVARGVHRHAIFREMFQSPAGRQGEGPFTVRFERSGRELTWTGGSLLQLGLANGLALPSGCRIGQCETCLLRVRSGAVAHLTEVDLAEENTCLGCVAQPCSDLVLDA
jgi:anaerobic selenocysteine-containing dehydrogenase/ferredoxin-NADP reductase